MRWREREMERRGEKAAVGSGSRQRGEVDNSIK